MDEFQILGYWVTRDPVVLTTFLLRAEERYNAIEAAVAPLKESAEDLAQDWLPRSQDYWDEVIRHLAQLRQAQQACLALFAKAQNSAACPAPLFVVSTVIRHRSFLHLVEEYLEEAGTLLTIHCATPQVLEESYIRQRQAVFQALRNLCEAVQEAVTYGRAELATRQSRSSNSRPRQSRPKTSSKQKEEEL